MLMLLGAIFSALCDFFTYITALLLIHCFYDAKLCLSKKKVLLFLSLTVLEGVILYFFPSVYESFLISVIAIILNVAIAIYDYPGKKIQACWRFCFYCAILMFFTIINAMLVEACLFNNIYNTSIVAGEVIDVSIEINPESTFISAFAGTIFFGATFLFLYRQYRKGVVLQCGKREVLLLCITIFLTFIAVTLVGFSDYNANLLRWVLAFYVALWAFVFPIFLYSSRINDYYRNRTAAQEQHMLAELDHFQQYRQTQEEKARFHHDIRNNLLCLNNMMQDGKTEEAAAYLKDLVKAVDRPSKKYITGDSLLDGIVAAKAQQMEKHDIRFQLDGVIAGGLPWKPMDICNVFANALDNAIEACQNGVFENPVISMRIRSTPQFWFVTIENPVVQKIDTSKLFRKDGSYTSKADTARHGIGTYNMKCTVDSYGDMLKAECSDDTFTLEIMIDKTMTYD